MADPKPATSTMDPNPSSTSLTKRPAPGSLMPPPPAPKRIKRPTVVLEEDTYTSAISHIIRRDFFPGLEEIDAQRDYLNALNTGDKGWIRQAGKKLVDVMTPGPGGARRSSRGVGSRGATGFQTPRGRSGTAAGATPSTWGADTPVSVSGETVVDEDEDETQPEVDLSLSLSAFQSKYISEDQESFSQILDRQNAKRFAKNEWLRSGNRYASKQRLAQQKVLEAANPSTSQELVVRPSEDLDNRPSHVSTHKHVPFNTLMFPPESIEDWAPTRAQNAESASLAPPKAVVHANTRLPLPVSNPDIPARPSSPTMSAVRDAISGRPRLSQSEVGYSGSETPRVNGYAFVDAVGPEPGEDEDDVPTDLLERFGANKGGPSPFTINEAQRREKLHMKMVDRITETRTAKDRSTPSALEGIFKGGATPRFLSAPTPKVGGGVTSGGMTPGRKRDIGNLTPAAQRLFANVGGGKTPSLGVTSGFGGSKGGSSGLGKEWTPAPRVKRRA